MRAGICSVAEINSALAARHATNVWADSPTSQHFQALLRTAEHRDICPGRPQQPNPGSWDSLFVSSRHPRGLSGETTVSPTFHSAFSSLLTSFQLAAVTQ